RLTGHYSPASDVFSLGVIVLEMLTGKRLADLKAMFSEPSFGGELEKALRSSLSLNAAKAVADRLAPAFNPEPRARPAGVKTWAGAGAGEGRGGGGGRWPGLGIRRGTAGVSPPTAAKNRNGHGPATSRGPANGSFPRQSCPQPSVARLCRPPEDPWSGVSRTP